jgi:hypothetical protein
LANSYCFRSSNPVHRSPCRPLGFGFGLQAPLPLVQDNLVDDLLMPTEVTALLGVTTLNQSFWPPLEMFWTSQHFNSEWSPANEEWFDRQVRKILAGDTSALTLQKQWMTHFHRRGIQELPALAMVVTEDHAQSSQDVLLASFPDIWDTYNATNIMCASS